jgi:hypothetical protein
MVGFVPVKDVVSDRRVILEEYESVAGTAANSFELIADEEIPNRDLRSTFGSGSTVTTLTGAVANTDCSL